MTNTALAAKITAALHKTLGMEAAKLPQVERIITEVLEEENGK